MQRVEQRVPVACDHHREFVQFVAHGIGGPSDAGTADHRRLEPTAESALRESTVDDRFNGTGVGDDDATIIEPVASVAA